MGHRRGDDCPATGLGGIAMTRRVQLPTEDEKRRERGHAVGLFRYQLICPALDAGLSTKARGRLVREIAGKEHTDPFGAPVRYSRDTLDRWIRRYRAGGFSELIPSPRALSPRTDGATLELAAALKRENPARTAAQVQRILRASAGWSPSESTLLRLFHRLELVGPTAGDAPAVFGRFEAENPNDRWTGDALHGRKIGGRKTYLFAFLDDHSRLVCGYRFGFAEDTVRLGVALEPALACRGVPASVYVAGFDTPYPVPNRPCCLRQRHAAGVVDSSGRLLNSQVLPEQSRRDGGMRWTEPVFAWSLRRQRRWPLHRIRALIRRVASRTTRPRRQRAGFPR
jgi:transposase